MAAKVDDYERSDLPERHKVALRLADAMMTRPGDMSDELVADLRRHFSAEQLVELTADIMKWNYQKVSVATRTDREIVPGQIADLVFDEQGHFVRPS